MDWTVPAYIFLVFCIVVALLVTFLPILVPFDGESDMTDEEPTLDTRGPDDRQ